MYTYISFQIITKEAVANDWKKKYEDSKQEVSEMRWENILMHSAISDWR